MLTHLQGPRDPRSQGVSTARRSETRAAPRARLPGYCEGLRFPQLGPSKPGNGEENPLPHDHSLQPQSQAWTLPIPPPHTACCPKHWLLCCLKQLTTPL